MDWLRNAAVAAQSKAQEAAKQAQVHGTNQYLHVSATICRAVHVLNTRQFHDVVLLVAAFLTFVQERAHCFKQEQV